MKGQTALIVDLSTGESVSRPLDDHPHYVGAVEYALDWPGGLVLGNGPLAATPAVGTHELALAGPSPQWGALYGSNVPGAGLAFDGLGCSVVALRGRVLMPSVLVLRGEAGGVVAEVEPLDPTEIWAEAGAPALLDQVVSRCAQQMSSFRVLACGPGSAVTPPSGIVRTPRGPALVSIILVNRPGTRTLRSIPPTTGVTVSTRAAVPRGADSSVYQPSASAGGEALV